MTNLFTKHALCAPLVITETKDVAKKIVEYWVVHFCVPDILHKDQGKNFGRNLIKELSKLLTVDKRKTLPYHPQRNDQVERHNCVIADVLLNYCAENLLDWDTMLPYANFVYNTTNHRTAGASPFSASIQLICSTQRPSIKKGPGISLWTGLMGNSGRPILRHGSFGSQPKNNRKINFKRKFLENHTKMKTNTDF